MKRSRGARNGWKHMEGQLKLFYGYLAGELMYIEKPPKSMDRKWRGREAFQAQAEARRERADRLQEALPQLLHVIQFLDPEWLPEMAKLVAPYKDRGAAPPVGWVEAAFSVLREADRHLSIGEVVKEIADRYDEVDLTPVGARQKAALAVSASLLDTYRHLLVEHPDGRKWALAGRAALFTDG